jgi:hypothetical protein
MDLSDITIVILSRGRENALRRTLNYWESCNAQVIVLHNTKLPLSKELFSRNIQYEVITEPFSARCGIVPKFLKTQFAILGSDDEVYIHSALKSMEYALKVNPEIVSVGGCTVGAGKYGPMTYAAPAYQNMYGYRNISNDPLERIRYHFNPSVGFRTGGMYRLMRAPIMATVMESFSNMTPISTPYIFEISGEILINACGPSIYLPNVYWIRNWNNEVVNDGSWNRGLSFTNWITMPKYHSETIEWFNAMREFIPINQQDFELVIQHVIKWCVETDVSEYSHKKRRLPISDNLKFIIRSVLARKSLPPSVTKTLTDMRSNNIVFDEREIRKAIRNII